MSRLLQLLEEAHLEGSRAGFINGLVIVQRRANRRELERAASLYARAAALMMDAAAALTDNGRPTNE